MLCTRAPELTLTEFVPLSQYLSTPHLAPDPGNHHSMSSALLAVFLISLVPHVGIISVGVVYPWGYVILSHHQQHFEHVWGKENHM